MGENKTVLRPRRKLHVLRCPVHGTTGECQDCKNLLIEISKITSDLGFLKEIKKTDYLESGKRLFRFIDYMTRGDDALNIEEENLLEEKLNERLLSYIDFLMRGSVYIGEEDRRSLIAKIEEINSSLNFGGKRCAFCGTKTDYKGCPTCREFLQNLDIEKTDPEHLPVLQRRPLMAAMELKKKWQYHRDISKGMSRKVRYCGCCDDILNTDGICTVCTAAAETFLDPLWFDYNYYALIQFCTDACIAQEKKDALSHKMFGEVIDFNTITSEELESLIDKATHKE